MPVPDKRVSKHSIKSIFHDVQFSESNHPTSKRILTNIYQKSNFEDFFNEFLLCLKVCLIHHEKSANVERTLDFAADFAVSFSSGLKEEESCPLLEGTFKFIFENHDCDVQLVRLRICQLMNRLLNNMGQDATVLEDTYNKIAENMLMRMQDCMSSVRTQAVYALHRLQSPDDPKCDIILAFIYHMTYDPSHEVRRAIIQKIAVNKITLASVLTRMKDVKDVVRKEAYIVISRFFIRQFTIRQRQLILECGLGDRSEVSRKFVAEVLVPNWLKYFKNNYYEFLECIHVEKIPETGLKLLKVVFAKQKVVILESSLKDMGIINKKVAFDRLNSTTVIFWRAMAEFVKPSDENDKFEHIFEKVLPDLTPFCKYIREYYFHNDDSVESPIEKETEDTSRPVQEGQADVSTPHVANEMVLVHLLEMCKVYDLSDEMGRNSLQQLSVDLLQSDRITLVSVGVLARLLNHTIPGVSAKLNIMAEIITDLREPLQPHSPSVYVPNLLLQEAEEKKRELEEKIVDLTMEFAIAEELGDDERMVEITLTRDKVKDELKIMNTVSPDEPGRIVNNDPDTLKKCLTIVVEIMKTGKITKMDPTLYSLMQNFIIPTLNLKVEEEEYVIKNLSLQVLSMFCVLDAELAKEHFFMFCFTIASANMSVTALKCVFDLLLVYGLSYFNIKDPNEEVEENTTGDGKQMNLIVLLMSLLESKVQDMKRVAVTGLSKLLFSGRIKYPKLLSKMILLWFEPDHESDPHIRLTLGMFFRMFATRSAHAPQLLLKAFLPTIKELFAAEVNDITIGIDVNNVANLMVDLTRPNINKFLPKDQNIHNQLAIKLCEEVLTEEYEAPNTTVFLKILNHLDLNYDLASDVAIISALAARMTKTIGKEEKNLQRLVSKFEMSLQMHMDKNKTVSTINNTLSAEVSLKSDVISRASASELLLGSRKDTDSEDEAISEDCEDSPDETISRLVGDEDEVIEGTPESSDNESESNPPAVKSARLSEDSFKLPTVPPIQTPFKVPNKTPKRAVKTPAKNPSSKVKNITLEESVCPLRERPLVKRRNVMTAEISPKTPAKKLHLQKEMKTPAKNAKTPAKIQVKAVDTPVKSLTEEQSVSDRVTRSSRKRKS